MNISRRLIMFSIFIGLYSGITYFEHSRSLIGILHGLKVGCISFIVLYEMEVLRGIVQQSVASHLAIFVLTLFFVSSSDLFFAIIQEKGIEFVQRLDGILGVNNNNH